MRPEEAIEALENLKVEAANPLDLYEDSGAQVSWKARVRAVVAQGLGEQNVLVKKLEDNSYSLLMFTSNTPDGAFAEAFVSGVRRAVGYIDAAIYELQLLTDTDEPVDVRSFDPELWEHVSGLVEDEDWGKVASQVSIFVEDKIRAWSGLDGGVYGKGLYAQALGDAAELRLGQKRGEWEGWRSLGVGFAQAIGNVDRHRLQDRRDARRYAIGVLGLGSLLLTQMRFEHVEIIEGAQSE